MSFHRTPAPTLEEIRFITEKIERRVHRWLEKRMEESGDDEGFGQKEPLLAACYGASIRYLMALGARAGQPLMRAFSTPPEVNNDREERTVAGFNLHVSIPIEATDRRGLERQLRYMGRPLLSTGRLFKHADADGRLILRLKTPWEMALCTKLCSQGSCWRDLLLWCRPRGRIRLDTMGCLRRTRAYARKSYCTNSRRATNANSSC